MGAFTLFKHTILRTHDTQTWNNNLWRDKELLRAGIATRYVARQLVAQFSHRDNEIVYKTLLTARSGYSRICAVTNS